MLPIAGGPDRVGRNAWECALGECDDLAQVVLAEAAEKEFTRDPVMGGVVVRAACGRLRAAPAVMWAIVWATVPQRRGCPIAS